MAKRQRRGTRRSGGGNPRAAEGPVAQEAPRSDGAERQPAGERLLGSDEGYRALAEAARDFIFVVGRDLTVRYCNTFGAAQLGRRPEDLIGKTVPDLFPPPYCERMVRNLSGVIETGTPLFVEDALPFGDRLTWLETRLVPVRDPAGAVDAVLGVSRDTTARRQAEDSLRYRVALEGAVSAVSAEFVGLPAEQVDAGIDRALKTIGELTGSDRSYVFLYAGDGTLSNTHEWCAPGIAPQKDQLQSLPVSPFPWVLGRLTRGESVLIPRVAALPPEAAAERQTIEELGIRSLVLVPMASAGTPIGFLGFDAVRAERDWADEDVALLRTVGDVFAGALARRRTEEELQHRSEFQALIAAISSRFIRLSAGEVDEAIRTALRALGEFAHVDRSYVFQFSEDHTRCSCTHEWCADAIKPAIGQLQNLPVTRFPWALERHLRGETVHVPHVGLLPPEAQDWREELEREGIQSLVCVPMALGGTVRGFVGFDSVRAEKRWSQDGIALLRIVGEMFVNALERQRAEEALRASEARFRAVVTDQTEMINRYLPNTTITFVNEASARVFGKTVDELVGKSWLPLLPEESRGRVLALIASLNAANPTATIEHPVVADNGEIRWQQWTNRAICDEHGRIVEYQAVGRDITERKRAEEALRASEEKWRTLVENAPDHVVAVDRDGTIQFMNRVLPGYRLDQVVGTNVCNYILPEHHGVTRSSLARVFETGEATQYEVQGRGAGESVAWYSTRVGPLLHDGKVAAALLISTDITERKRAEEALRLSEHQYRTTLDSMGDAIHVADATLHIVLVNAAFLTWCAGFGLDTDAVGRSVFEVFPFLPERVADEYRQVFETGRPLLTEEKTSLGERQVFTETRKIPVFEGVRVVRVITVVRDITQQRRAEEEARRVRHLEALGLLAGGIAHDFNNMLMGILASLSLAKLNHGTSRDVADILQEAEKAVVRARGLTQQLLTFSKGGAPVRRAASVAELLRDTVGFALAGSNVRSQYTLPDDLWPVEIDPAQISQVVQNLVINAKQAMPAGGVVEILAENRILQAGETPPLSPGRFVRIAVRDHGAGIAPENLPRVFDPYFTTKGTGSGLGLTICHSIVRKHDGHIRIESQPGAGTTIEVYLPASETSAPPPPTRTPRQVRRGRLLVMDDDAIIRRGVQMLLQSVGYQVECAADGAEALQAYQTARAEGRPFDAVLLDLTVPAGMGGEECLRRLLETDPATRGIVSSGYAEDSVMADFRQHGFRAVVPKPYTLEELLRALDEATQREEE
jgi:PAS domain S-box-containing protein